ncbi:MAG: hypothetical protein IPH05_17525 [Flavobacteriales bacterium]|nr:hypothetical protein [Flavobacteriales bacterium]
MNQQGDRLANASGRSMAITNSDWLSTAYFDVLDFDNTPGCSPLSAAIPSAAPLDLFSRGYGVEFCAQRQPV